MTTSNDEQSYLNRARSELQRLLTALDGVAAENEEFDVELANDIVTLEFPDGAKYIINSHRAARQIWMAADARAWHFDCASNDSWQGSKGEGELWSVVQAQLNKKLGRVVALSPAEK
jgi:CyaY protein